MIIASVLGFHRFSSLGRDGFFALLGPSSVLPRLERVSSALMPRLILRTGRI